MAEFKHNCFWTTENASTELTMFLSGEKGAISFNIFPKWSLFQKEEYQEIELKERLTHVMFSRYEEFKNSENFDYGSFARDLIENIASWLEPEYHLGLYSTKSSVDHYATWELDGVTYYKLKEEYESGEVQYLYQRFLYSGYSAVWPDLERIYKEFLDTYPFDCKRKALSKKIRFEVFKKDNFTCQYCGAKAPKVELHVDHIKPVSRGGTNELENLTTSCLPCNLGKGNRELEAVKLNV
jgi:hypothetical protein